MDPAYRAVQVSGVHARVVAYTGTFAWIGAPRISHRERQVLDCVMKSQSNKEIGAELHISESTVKFHLARLFEKFGVRRRSDLILQTVQQTAPVVH